MTCREFRIQTSSFAPEFGRTPGGQISIVTRSGTNAFHGTLFDYFRNDALDAKDWFSNFNHLPKPADRQNDFGGVFGGPILKDKTFFFFSYEGLRLHQPVTQTTAVPDAASRQQAPAAMQPFLNAYPIPPPGAPEVGPGLAQFNASYSNPSSLDAYSIRVDHVISSKLTLFGRYNYSPSSLDQPSALQVLKTPRYRHLQSDSHKSSSLQSATNCAQTTAITDSALITTWMISAEPHRRLIRSCFQRARRPQTAPICSSLTAQVSTARARRRRTSSARSI